MLARVGEARDRPPIRATIASLLWAALIGTAHLWGRVVVENRPATRIFVPPLIARVDPASLLGSTFLLSVGAVLVVFGPRIASSVAWRPLMVAGFAGAAIWSVALGFTGGTDGLIGPFEFANDYRHDIDLVETPGDFLDNFTERIDSYNQHVRAHPPGMVLLLWSMDRIGLSGPGWEAVLILIGWASVVPAIMVTLREIAGELRARVVAPFLALAPAAIWAAGSADGLFAGVGAWAVALMVLATAREGRRSMLLAVSGGLLLAAGLLLSYGLTLMAIPPLIVAFARRRRLPTLMAGATALIMLALVALSGFSWIEGTRATLVEYRESVARIRPYSYFLLGNLAAFAIAVGPATVVALSRLRHRPTWLLVAGGLMMVGLADLAGLSKGEVERIWLPFVPWVMVATSELHPRLWLPVNTGFAILVEVALNTTW